MAKKVITQEQKDARALGLVIMGGILFFPALNFIFKFFALLQNVLFGYVQ